MSDTPNTLSEVIDDIYAEIAQLRERLARFESQVCVDPTFEGQRCPFTKRQYFMHLDHPELGRVATYGGPFDSYTVPIPDEDMTLRCERYDHDAGAWVDGGEPTDLCVVPLSEVMP